MKTSTALKIPGRGGLFLGGAIAALALLTAWAVPGPQDRLSQGFELNYDWDVHIDGAPDPDARVYRGRDPVVFVVLSPSFERSLLLWPKDHRVEVFKQGDVRIDEDDGLVIADAYEVSAVGSFVVANNGVEFDFEERRIRVAPKPPLLGYLTVEEIQENDPRFRTRADAYQPDPDLVSQIRAFPQQVLVTVFLGTWCPHCQNEVPKIMRLERELQGSKVGFRYYGVPRRPQPDPEIPSQVTDEDGELRGLPTIAVTLGGGEFIGQIIGKDTETPEVKLSQILSQAGQGSQGGKQP